MTIDQLLNSLLNERDRRLNELNETIKRGLYEEIKR